jgi:3-methyladenine DNA glycosylase/8-oxoguanine DNA glycosylase
VLAGVIEAVGPYRLTAEVTAEAYPAAGTIPFRALARAITFQQLNGTAARSIFERWTAVCAQLAEPLPHALLATPEERLRAAGLSRAKIAALRDLANKVLDGTVPSHEELQRLDDATIIERVSSVRGIGRWTVEMMLMFQLGRPDVLPVDDYGVRTGFRLAYGLRSVAPAVIARYGELWRPHRTAASWYLWRAVDLARAGRLPSPPVRIRMPRLRRPRKSRTRHQAQGK